MTASDGRYTDDRHFHKKRKKARESSGNNMTERLAPGHLRLLSDERVCAHNRGKEEMVLGLTSSFVFCDPVSLSITLCVYRARKFAKKPDQHEMMSGDGAAPKATRGRVHTPKISQPLEK
jgi:hypothetical protein